MSVDKRAFGFSFVIFSLTLALYFLLVPWLTRVWARTGDEPHYLVAAHSLVYDGDLDLNNNYAQRDYVAFYTETYLDPHVRLRPDGSGVLTHNLGLSFLIAPAYWAGGLAGVEYFLAVLGALLATNIFLLAQEVTGNWRAALVGWIALAFAPPLVWYVFLIYPEVAAALCILYPLRQLLRSATTLSPLTSRFSLLISLLCLFALPWLSSRYLPLFGLLIGGAAWLAWKQRSRAWLIVVLGGLVGLGAYTLFSQWLYGNASPAAAYAGDTPLTFTDALEGVRVWRGLLGWLFDNQRGLLITAPIYLCALWGGGVMVRQRPLLAACVLAPFSVMLIVVSLWGGFWVEWDYSARFLIVGLPPLGAGVAYLWATQHRLIVWPLTVALFALSMGSGINVMRYPLMGLVSSPIETLRPQINLEDILPAMARYVVVPAGTGAVVGEATPAGWHVSLGQSGIALRQVNIAQFQFGWYTAHLPLTITQASPDAPLLNVKLFSPRYGDYFAQTVYTRDLVDNAFTFNFKSPVYNGWGFPPTLLVSSTGQAELHLGPLLIEPDAFHSFTLPLLWLIALLALGLLLTRRASPLSPRASPHLPSVASLLLLLPLFAFFWSLRPQPRVYDTPPLRRTVGLLRADALAYQGQTMEADPERGQDAGQLAVTFPELYAPGPYRLTVSLRAANVMDPHQPLAAVQVQTTSQAVMPQQWVITAADLPLDDQYHRFALDFDNPRGQALTFVLEYPANALLRADVITVEPRP